MEDDWEFGLLFIVVLLLLPFGEIASIIGMVVTFLVMNWLKK